MKCYNDLGDFLRFLESQKLLLRVQDEISTHLEITHFSERVLKSGGPAILFENVINHNNANAKSDYSVVTNLFGTVERVALGLGVEKSGLRDLGRLLAFFKHPKPPSSFKEAYDMLPLAKRLLSFAPKIVSRAKCQEVVYQNEDIDVFKFPIQFCWPNDVTSLITWPMVITKGSVSKSQPDAVQDDLYNLGIYRLQPLAKDKLIVRWLKLRGGAQHFSAWKSSSDQDNNRFPIAIAIGSDPGLIISAVTPVPNTVSEYNFAGLLRSKSVELVKCKTNDLLVPANAEIIIEGYISLNEYADEGPYGDHTGYYNEVDSFPVMQITAITTKSNAIYLSTYTSRPPDEPSILGEALNELFVPIVQEQFPEIIDFWLPPEGCSYRVAVVSIKKRYPGHAKRIMMGIWSFLQQFMYTKYVIIVDDDINIRDWKDVIWAISTRSDPVRDTVLIDNTPIDYLDFASPKSGLGGKMGIDATNKMPPETSREWGVKITMKKDVEQKIDALLNRIYFKL